MGLQLSIGDRAPDVIGATAEGRFYSLDAQAGRPVLLAPLGGLELETARKAFQILRAAQPRLASAGVDVAPIVPPRPEFTVTLAGEPGARESVVYVTNGAGLGTWTPDGTPTALLVDRGGRIVEVIALSTPDELIAQIRRAAPRIASDAPRRRASSAPVLVIPNVASPAFCEALIDHFEASPHAAGTVAAFTDGVAHNKLDEDKKRRRDLELTADSPLFAEAVALLSTRVTPEIRRAFNVDVVNADRLLIARYDDDGGHFKRHRDNAAPHTAFREFAISLNLNTHAYEGGELMFPEFDDDRYNPPAGAAIVFSASLLHEVSPMVRGSRYVLLSFLGSAAAQNRLNRWLERQAQAQPARTPPAAKTA